MFKKRLRILLLILLIPTALLLVLSGLLYRNQESLVKEMIETLNESLPGTLSIEGSRIALLANFPYISIDLRNVKFYESKDTSQEPLYQVADLYVGFDIWDVLAGKYDIKGLKIKDASVNLILYEDGSNNILRAKGQTGSNSETEAQPMNIDLQRVVIQNLEFRMYDETVGRELLAHLHSLNARIAYKQAHFYIDVGSDLHLDLKAKGQETFFVNKHLVLDLEFDFDEVTQLLTLEPSTVALENALFKASGTLDLDDSLRVDLQIRGDKPDFSIFAAFAPADLAEALNRYKSAGQIYFQGSIQGPLSGSQLPEINVEFGCENAYFLNPSVNKRVDDLAFKGYFTNGAERTLASSELRLTNFYAKPEQGVFQGSLIVRNFLNPFIQTDLHADLDLEFLGQFFQMEGLRRLQGQILLDMRFNELVDLEFGEQSLAQLKTGIDSDLHIRNLSFLIPGYPHTIRNANGHAFMKEGKLQLDSLRFFIADSDFRFSGAISDVPALLHRYDKPLTVKLSAHSDLVDLRQLFEFDTSLQARFDERIENFQMDVHFDTRARELFDYTYLPRGEFFIDDLYAKFEHYPHALHDFHADILIGEKEIRIVDFSGEIDQSDFHFSGAMTNYPKWFQEVAFGDSRLEFDLQSKLLRINDLLTYKGENYLPEQYRNEEFRELNLKGYVDLHYDSSFQSADLYLRDLDGKMSVHPLKLYDFKGRIHYENDQVLVEEFSGRLGKSDFHINASYYWGPDPSLRKRDCYFKLRANTLDLDALMAYQGPAEQTDHQAAFNIFELPFPDMRFQADIGRMNYHRYWLEEVHLDGWLQTNHFLYIEALHLRVAEGKLNLKGYFNGSDSANIYFSSTLNAEQLDLDKLLFKFDNFGQDQLIHDNIRGKVSGTITSKFKMHPDLTPIVEHSTAHMELTIIDGSLVNFGPMEAMSSYFQDQNLRLVRFDTLQNTLDLNYGVLSIPAMNINSSLGFMEISGKQSLDLSMEYFIRIPLKMVTQVGVRSLFGKKSAEEIPEDQIDEIQVRNSEKRVRFLNLKVSGTVDDYKITVGKQK